MSNVKVFGQIIALTRSIYLNECSGEECYRSSFMVNQNKNSYGGLGLEWWYTTKTFDYIDRIAAVIQSTVLKYSNIDFESIKELVISALQVACSDSSIIDLDGFLINNKETLFDIRVCIPDEFSIKIWNVIELKLDESITDWCTLYPLSRMKVSSFHIKELDIYVVNKFDTEYFKNIIVRFPYLKIFNPSTGRFEGVGRFQLISFNYESLIISIDSGTLNGTKFSASIKIRAVISILTSWVNYKYPKKIMKSAQRANTHCLQVPCSSSEIKDFSSSSIGDLCPYYIRDYDIENTEVKKILEWFSKLHDQESSSIERVYKSAHFINLALNADGIESFVNYFVSLDALFGIRGSVEKSIVEGVKSIKGSDEWKQRTEWLFDLRNELVHGGSRYLAEWKRYEDYISHFSSKPEIDIKELSFECLRIFVEIKN